MLFFLFPVPPRVAPFAFRSDPEAGIRIQVPCSLEEGDLPVEISWLKDGTPLPKNRGFSSPSSIDIREYDEYSSMLVIANLRSEHSGNYTCRISNAARVATRSAVLTVSGTW